MGRNKLPRSPRMCPSCGITKPIEEFKMYKNGTHRARCYDCFLMQKKVSRAKADKDDQSPLEALKEICKREGISLVDIALKGYISQQMIHGGNKHKISLFKAREIAKKLGYKINFEIKKITNV